MFPADDPLRQFHGEDHDELLEWDDEGHEYLPVGSIDLTIRVGEMFALFSYAASTSWMSDLFEKSRPIWRQFDTIRESSGGLVGFFSGCSTRGIWCYPLLPDGRDGVPLNFFEFVLEERDTYWHLDVDRFAHAALSTPRTPVSSNH
ncbi:hypothetical protein [Gemmata sp.]|uniref:hypothetical protein n=1 Tax=Gemmata sp. TaxID=1914242 RepID=UPI003F71DAC4